MWQDGCAGVGIYTLHTVMLLYANYAWFSLPYARGNCCDPDWSVLILKWITIFTKVANHAVLIYPGAPAMIA